jgi:uncharacterized membrane protein (DUF373 family)
METYIARFEKLVYLILIILLGIVILFSISGLIGLIYSGLFVDSIYRLDNHELVNLFGFFLLVIIGIELLETLKTYLKENTIHFEIVILVALIAIARKVILLEPDNYSNGIVMIGIGVIILSLGAAYLLIKKAKSIETHGPDVPVDRPGEGR